MHQQDLTTYGDQELSLQVFNTEPLYNMRHDESLPYVLADMFYYSEAQWDELQRDLMEDLDDE